MPIGVFTPVASMSTRFWIGIVQTFVQPGIWTARSSSPPNAASSSRSTFQSRSRRLKLRRKLVLDRVERRLRLDQRARRRLGGRPVVVARRRSADVAASRPQRPPRGPWQTPL